MLFIETIFPQTIDTKGDNSGIKDSLLLFALRLFDSEISGCQDG